MPINMGELLPTPSVMQPHLMQPERSGGLSPANDSPGSKATPKDLDNALEPVLCHHCGRTASNGISCEGYCVADSNY
jgi:hypothetical protein